MQRFVLLGAAVIALLLAGAPSLLGKVSELRLRLTELGGAQKTAATQSAAQISAREYRGLADGLTPGMRARVGAPKHTSVTLWGA